MNDELKKADPVGEREGSFEAQTRKSVPAAKRIEEKLRNGTDMTRANPVDWIWQTLAYLEEEGFLARPLASKPSTSARDWTEDASHENGNYFCNCVSCGQKFIGHKRRVQCKLCASKPSAEGIPERPKATGNFGGNLACNVHNVYSYCDKVEAIISAKEAEIAAGRAKYSAYRNEMVEALAAAEGGE